MKRDGPLTVQRLKQLFRYDKSSGTFACIKRRGRIMPGEPVGWLNDQGYHLACIDRRIYRMHRVAWLYVYGRWPAKDIDHANGDTSDNRISNLREASGSDNLGNMKKPRTNRSGKKGVSWHKKAGKWQTHIRVRGINLYLGLFTDLKTAHAAYADAARYHRGEFARVE